MKNESNNTKKIIEWWEAEKAMKNAKIPEIGKEFSTKDDACIAALGHKMNNRMHMGEEHERYNICFMQRGASSYIKDGKKVETGFNRIYADKVESLRANRKEWMPNFKNIVTSRPVATVTEFFGVDTAAPHEFGDGQNKWHVFHQHGYGGTANYIDGTKTVLDGWGEEFYYYSPPPYQSYQLWSSGPNKRTFPPWMDPASTSNPKLVNKWIADDIKVGDK